MTTWYPLGRNDKFVMYELHDLVRLLGNTEDTPVFDEYVSYEFEIRPYSWADCTCKAHAKKGSCKACRPNFKCGDFELRWYKYIGRGMDCNKRLSRKKMRRMFEKCRRSISPWGPA